MCYRLAMSVPYQPHIWGTIRKRTHSYMYMHMYTHTYMNFVSTSRSRCIVACGGVCSCANIQYIRVIVSVATTITTATAC